MWLMKGDLGGAAAIMGTMYALAARRAAVNVVAVTALIENMPSGSAQRSGDIVHSMSGKTIEVVNTDAEVRLSLADVLWYTQERFKPAFLITLATMTGSKGVALGSEYAALFSNDDSLNMLTAAGRAEDEKLWRLPLHENYREDIKSKVADVFNVGAGNAGAIVAAMFLAEFCAV